MWTDWLRRTLKARDRETDGFQRTKPRDAGVPHTVSGLFDLETVVPCADALPSEPAEDQANGQFRT
jgi:hypothetical protein